MATAVRQRSGSVLDQSVSQEKDESWTFQCPGVEGSVCGDPAGAAFKSSGWPSKKVAKARGEQHFDDHRLGAHVQAAVAAAGEDHDRAALLEQAMKDTGLRPTPSLEEFRAEHGLVQHPNGTHAVRIEDLP